ncbi:MAG: 2-hydroxyacid dehydrogenase [Bacteriovorax sp.]|jgi:D-lactate dehydrogenase
MRVAIFGCNNYDRKYFLEDSLHTKHELVFFETRLNELTAHFAAGFGCACIFANDNLNAKALEIVSKGGTKLVALRSAGFDNVDLHAADALGIRVVHVPSFSPNAIAEHAVSLILTLNRKIHLSYNRIRAQNFSLNGLVGFDLRDKVVGIMGTGRIGAIMARIMLGFDCEVIAHDVIHNPLLENIGVTYVSLDKLLKSSDIISLHLPLNPKTRNILDAKALSLVKPGMMLINTARGALIDTKELINCLKSGAIGYAGLDVYEKEEGLFFEDHSDDIIQDDMLCRLLAFPNVVLTSHQAFLTEEALINIAHTTLKSIQDFETGAKLLHEISY